MKPFPQATRSQPPKGHLWESHDGCINGQTIRFHVFEASFDGHRQPRPRFELNGEWWSVPFDLIPLLEGCRCEARA